MMSAYRGFIFGCTAGALVCAGYAGPPASSQGTNGFTSARKVRATISLELPRGSPADQTEAFFKRHQIPYSYDQTVRRYYGSIRNLGPFDRSIEIYIDTDAAGMLVKTDAFNYYTFL
jgi:hypothetical protein